MEQVSYHFYFDHQNMSFHIIACVYTRVTTEISPVKKLEDSKIRQMRQAERDKNKNRKKKRDKGPREQGRELPRRSAIERRS